jgi:hypothetical protein
MVFLLRLNGLLQRQEWKRFSQKSRITTLKNVEIAFSFSIGNTRLSWIIQGWMVTRSSVNPFRSPYLNHCFPPSKNFSRFMTGNNQLRLTGPSRIC